MMVSNGQVKKYFINLSLSKLRRKKMYLLWWPNVISRFEAIDGWRLANGKYDNYGRPFWIAAKKKELVSKGILHPDSDLTPTEYACNQSHVDVWRTFLKTDSKALLVLEDDTRPTKKLRGLEVEGVLRKLPEVDKCDLLYLFGPNHSGRRLALNKNATVRYCRSHMGYLMSRKAAHLAIAAMTPMYYLSDTQTGIRIFKSMEKQEQIKLPDSFEELEKIEAMGLFDPLVEHNELATASTFTFNGNKEWLPKGFRV